MHLKPKNRLVPTLTQEEGGKSACSFSFLLFFKLSLIWSSPQPGLPCEVTGPRALAAEAADQGEPQAGSPAPAAAGRAEPGLQRAAAG